MQRYNIDSNVGHDTGKRILIWSTAMPLRWRHNGRDSVSKHQSHDCLLNSLFPTQMVSNAENVSIWWRHHAMLGFMGSGTLSVGMATQGVVSKTHAS